MVAGGVGRFARSGAEPPTGARVSGEQHDGTGLRRDARRGGDQRDPPATRLLPADETGRAHHQPAHRRRHLNSFTSSKSLHLFHYN